MRLLYRFSFNKTKTAIIAFLEKHRISYQSEEIIAYLEMFSNEDIFEQTLDVMKKEKAAIISQAVFSKEEIDASEWLAVRSEWVTQYPEPRDNMSFFQETYFTEDFCKGNPPRYYCRQGLKQKQAFVVKKQPNWSSRGFCMLNWVGDELFVSDKTKTILSDSNLTGFSFQTVKKIGGEIHSNFSQLKIENSLKIGLSCDSVEKEFVCPICGRKKFWLRPSFIDVSSSELRRAPADIVKSTEKIGEIECNSLIVISAKFYRFLQEMKLERGLVFTPIRFV